MFNPENLNKREGQTDSTHVKKNVYIGLGLEGHYYT